MNLDLSHQNGTNQIICQHFYDHSLAKTLAFLGIHQVLSKMGKLFHILFISYHILYFQANSFKEIENF